MAEACRGSRTIACMSSESGQQYGMEELYTSTYGNHLLCQFNQFRQDDMFFDFEIRLDSHSFKVHRIVMAGCSDYFRAMFSHGMMEANSNFINLQSVSEAGLRPLLDYAYTGRLQINMTTLHDILPVAAFLQITPALELISNFLRSKMTFENADELVSLGDVYGLTKVAGFRKRLILDKFLEFGDTKEFLNLDGMVLSEYLEDDSLRTTTESQILKRVLRWYNHDRANRENVICHLLDRVRYTIDGWPAIKFASSHEPFKSNPKCREILHHCEAYMQDAPRKYLYQSHRTRVRYESQTIIQMGGIKSVLEPSVLGFALPGEEELRTEPRGNGRNHYYHKHLQRWFPLGINGTSDCRSHNPIVTVNDCAIMVGGFLYSSDMERTYNYQHCSDEVKLFTPGDFAMWDLPFMCEPRAHHAVIHVKGYLYAIGGKNEAGNLKSVERFNLETQQWKHVRSLEMAVSEHAAASCNDLIYVTGGVVNNVIVNTVWCYTSKDNEWTIKPALLTPRAGHTMTCLGMQLVVCGGQTKHNSSRCLSSVEAFDVEVQQWSYLTPMRRDCCDMAATVLEDKLLIVGGRDSVGDLLDQVQQYDPKIQKWSVYCTLPEPLKSLGCCTVTIKLNASGEDDTDNDSVVEEYCSRYQQECTDYYDDYESDSSDASDVLHHIRGGLHWQL